MFGSVAGNAHKKASDVNIFVELQPARMFDLIGIKQDLEVALSCKVDIVILGKKMNPVLRDQIERYGVHV